MSLIAQAKYILDPRENTQDESQEARESANQSEMDPPTGDLDLTT